MTKERFHLVAMSKSSSTDNNQSSPSSSWWPFSSAWKEQWEEFHDSQRMERLATCLQLDQILQKCRQRQQQSNHQEDMKNDPLEAISPGLRTMKYYGWRGILTNLSSSSASNGHAEDTEDQMQQEQPKDDNTTFHKALHDQIQNSCSREQHAVWACRAVATGCGKELAHLKKCFEEEHPNEQEMILVVPHTGYDTSAREVNNHIPCLQAQQTLGACVTANAKSLLERKQRREVDSSKQQHQ